MKLTFGPFDLITQKYNLKFLVCSLQLISYALNNVVLAWVMCFGSFGMYYPKGKGRASRAIGVVGWGVLIPKVGGITFPWC